MATTYALIIEDDELVAGLLETFLEDIGFTSIDIAPTPSVAVASAQEKRPDLIVADADLLHGSGIDAVEEICRDKTSPVVFISLTPAQVFKRMPKAFVAPKPLVETVFVERVRRALGSH